MVINQCDGCRNGNETDKFGHHNNPEMVCEKELYPILISSRESIRKVIKNHGEDPFPLKVLVEHYRQVLEFDCSTFDDILFVYNQYYFDSAIYLQFQIKR